MTSPPYAPAPADVQRVLLLSHTGLISGAERALLDLVCHLPPTVQAMVLAPEGPLSTLLRERGIRSLEVQGTAASLRLHPTQTPKGVMELVSSAVELRTAAFRTRSHVVHANSLRAGIIAVIARAIGGPRVITHIHDALPHDHVAHAVAALLARGSSALIAVSQFARARFLEAAGGDYPVTVLPNPVDLDRFTGPSRDRPALRRELRLPPTAPVIGVIGQITPWKGQHTAIAALATLRASAPDARLLIVGETKFVSPSTRYDNLRYERELRALISHFGLEDAVEFWGEREDIPSILCALDALLVPSDGEPLGRSVLEAMASGTPV
ncbi:MAG TPA: glycosyltransferase family 4 protein, partial [Pseudonocardiaceae bacterium]|nr:glycosyltransferase family 4 protein [Pseudonocardiaceae bacterium]